ncbi:hypothetical protein BCV70DRAFT_219698, partial [Testicularia cyperi]
TAGATHTATSTGDASKPSNSAGLGSNNNTDTAAAIAPLTATTAATSASNASANASASANANAKSRMIEPPELVSRNNSKSSKRSRRSIVVHVNERLSTQSAPPVPAIQWRDPDPSRGGAV